MWQKQMSPWILICVPKSHLIFRERERKKLKKSHCTDIFPLCGSLFFCLSSVDRQHNTVSLGKVRQKNPLLSGFPIPVVVIQERSECLT